MGNTHLKPRIGKQNTGQANSSSGNTHTKYRIGGTPSAISNTGQANSSNEEATKNPLANVAAITKPSKYSSKSAFNVISDTVEDIVEDIADAANTAGDRVAHAAHAIGHAAGTALHAVEHVVEENAANTTRALFITLSAALRAVGGERTKEIANALDELAKLAAEAVAIAADTSADNNYYAQRTKLLKDRGSYSHPIIESWAEYLTRGANTACRSANIFSQSVSFHQGIGALYTLSFASSALGYSWPNQIMNAMHGITFAGAAHKSFPINNGIKTAIFGATSDAFWNGLSDNIIRNRVVYPAVDRVIYPVMNIFTNLGLHSITTGIRSISSIHPAHLTNILCAAQILASTGFYLFGTTSAMNTVAWLAAPVSIILINTTQNLAAKVTNTNGNVEQILERVAAGGQTAAHTR